MKKIKNISKQFTYGFEIEGMFRKDLRKAIWRELKKRTKGDGSVRVNLPSGFNYEDWRGEEYALGVFQNYNDMIRIIKWFKNGENYFENESCGIHIHIKPRNNKMKKILRCMIGDYDLIRDLQQFAINSLCDRTMERVDIQNRKSHWSEPYSSVNDCMNKWRRNEKYVFIRNHTMGTFEFRFFSTCEHKVENIKKFFEYFFKKLAVIEPKKEKKILVKVEKKEIINIKEVIEKKKTIHIDYSFNSNSIIKL